MFDEKVEKLIMDMPDELAPGAIKRVLKIAVSKSRKNFRTEIATNAEKAITDLKKNCIAAISSYCDKNLLNEYYKQNYNLKLPQVKDHVKLIKNILITKIEDL